MRNMHKKSANYKWILSYFTAFFSGRNVYGSAKTFARSKNYNLRTAQKTITLFFLFAACAKFVERRSESHYPRTSIQYRWLSRGEQYYLRVQWLYISRMPQMLSKARKSETFLSSRQNCGRSIRSNPEKSGHSPRCRLHRSGNVGMRVRQAETNRSTASNLPGIISICPASGTTRCLFWGSNGRCDSVLKSR